MVIAAETITPNRSQRQIERSSSKLWASKVAKRLLGFVDEDLSVSIMESEICFSRSVHQPPTIPMTAALATLKSANGQPRNEALTRIESTPVCGVLIRKATVAPLDAPLCLRLRPTGITAQEQRGNGTPSPTALKTPKRPENCCFKKSLGSKTCSNPATSAPSSSRGPAPTKSAKTHQGIRSCLNHTLF